MGVGTKSLNWTCGLFATLLGLAVLPLALWSVYWAWLASMSGEWLLVAYNAAVALLWVGVPAVFLREYDRWQTKKGLQ
jgi:hypothetical protein